MLPIATNRFSRGFTLIELLTVIAIIGILAAIIIPVVGKVRHTARVATSVSNLRQLQLANIAYAADHKGVYVPVHKSAQDYNEGWPGNVVFASYCGAIKGGWNPGELIPIAQSGFRSTIHPGVVHTIAYNNTDNNKGVGGPGPWGKDRLRVHEPQNPSLHIAFAESTEWLVEYGARNLWSPLSDEIGLKSKALALRNNGKATVVTYAGNVTHLTRAEGNDKRRWIYDPSLNIN